MNENLWRNFSTLTIWEWSREQSPSKCSQHRTGRREVFSWDAWLANERVCETGRIFWVRRVRVWDLLDSYRKNLAGTPEGWIPAFSMTTM